MEGIEMRDFASKPPQDVQNELTTKVKPSLPEHGRLMAFWTTRVRITIHETESSAYAQYGVVIAQLFRLNTTSDGVRTPATFRIGSALGATTEAIAILVALIGASYFYKQQNGIAQGVVLSRGWEVGIMSLLSFVLLCIILGLLAAADSW